MSLPENVKQERANKLMNLWIYGDSFVGKSTFVDNFPNLLFLNTDGNTNNIKSPVIELRTIIEKDSKGRELLRREGWEILKDAINDILVDKSFDYICIDLLDDCLDLCRNYIYKREKVRHESEGAYSKIWDMVKIEFLNTIRLLKSANKNLIFISKESTDSIKKPNGETYNIYSPLIREKYANLLSGMVDMSFRFFVRDLDDKRFIRLNKTSNEFGGSRFKFPYDKIELNFDTFMEVYSLTVNGEAAFKHPDVKRNPPKFILKPIETETEIETEIETEPETEPETEKIKPKRTRKRKAVDETNIFQIDTSNDDPYNVEKVKPKRIRAKIENLDGDQQAAHQSENDGIKISPRKRKKRENIEDSPVNDIKNDYVNSQTIKQILNIMDEKDLKTLVMTLDGDGYFDNKADNIAYIIQEFETRADEIKEIIANNDLPF